MDLKKALVEGAINQKEYDLMKKKIIDDQYIKDIINEFDDEERRIMIKARRLKLTYQCKKKVKIIPLSFVLKSPF